MHRHITYLGGILVLTGLAPVFAGALSSLPLKMPQEKSSPQQFLSRPASETGIDFVHDYKYLRDYDYLNHSNSTLSGGGVAMGDFDNDGKVDVFLTSPTDGCKLYRNHGEFRFEDVTNKAGVSASEPWNSGPSVADVNNDGYLDIFLCRYKCPNLLYINQGNGTFKESAKEYGLDNSGASISAAFADYDLDGDLDLYLLTNRDLDLNPEKEPSVKMVDGKWMVHPSIAEHTSVVTKLDGNPFVAPAGQYDHFYRNNGDGTFSDVTDDAGLGGLNHHGLSVLWWDYDNDGDPDLYISNDFYGPDQLMRNNGDGTFVDVIVDAMRHTPWFSMGADFGDLNNDGWLDLMASDMQGTSHYRSKMMMGEMSDSAWFLASAVPRQYMRNAVSLNAGNGVFHEAAHMLGLAGTDWTWCVKMADLDNDGWQDVYVTNGTPRDWMNSDLLAEYNKHVVEEPTGRVAFEKVWRDGEMQKEKNYAFKNTGDLKFENVSKSWGLDHHGVSFGSALADLDNDGDLDLVTNNFLEPCSVYENKSYGENAAIVRLRGQSSNRFGVGARVEIQTEKGLQVRYLSPVRGIVSADSHALHFGLGEANEIKSLKVRWPSGRLQMFENLKVNHRFVITEEKDLPVSSPEEKPDPLFEKDQNLAMVFHQERDFNDFNLQPLLPNRLSQLGPGVAWGDVDADGDADFYLAGAAGQSGQLMLNGGNGIFASAKMVELNDFAEVEEMGAVFFDVEQDGDLDLYVVGGSTEYPPQSQGLSDRLYLNDGTGRFNIAGPDILPGKPASGGVVTAADFDRDGDTDLFVGGRLIPGRYPVTPKSSLWINEGGKFSNNITSVAPGLEGCGLVTGALWTDVNNDGWRDLMVTTEWGPVKLFLNQKGKLINQTKESGLFERKGWWNGISGGDFDSDGDTDYVVTNFGLNTKYHPTEKKPVSIYYGDLDNSGRPHLVEAKKIEDKIFPVRGKSCSTNAMPSLGKKFKTFHDFASSPLNQIYSSTCLNDAIHLKANTLESGVLLNDGSGKFSWKPLPRMAQISPAFGVVVEDFDQDGNLDVVLAQNFYGPQNETGRMDGGLSLLLRGNGKGDFSPVAPLESGISLPFDATSVTVCDVNQDSLPDLCVALNDGPLSVYVNRSKTKPGLTIEIPSGQSPTVSLALKDGRRPKYECYAGGGYLSQSESTIWLPSLISSQLEVILVEWPSGKTTKLTDVRGKSTIKLVASQ